MAHMEVWRSANDRKRLGIAIQNFWQDGPYRLKICVGDALIIQEENGDWYLGYIDANERVYGIFPKGYVHLRNSIPDDVGLEKEPNYGIMKEITVVLREWGRIWKQLYLKRHSNMEKIKDVMYDLIAYRSQILSGKLPKHQLQEMRSLVASLIDTGNKVLGLDMVVRDEEENFLNIQYTSAMRLFMEHELASHRMRNSIASLNPISIKNVKEDKKYYSNTLLVSIMNIIFLAQEDLEIVITLYDSITECPISESYVFLWRQKNHQEEVERLQNQKILFMDIGQQDVMSKKIYLVCYMVKISSTEQREMDYIKSLEEQTNLTSNKKMPSKKIQAKCKRRPFGVAAVDISSYLNVCAEDQDEDHIFVPFLRHVQGSMKSLLKHLINLQDAAIQQCLGQGLWMRLKLFRRDVREVITINQLKVENIMQAQKIGFPEIIFPTNVRNELYLSLVGGEFYRFLAPDKNVEVAVNMCSEDGKPISGAIQMGNRYLEEYRSVIYYRDSKPEWHEMVKINIPFTGFKGCHVKFTFSNRSARSNAEKPFAISYIDIVHKNGTLIKDGKHSLNIYMTDYKKFEEENASYLGLPAKANSRVEIKKNTVKGLTLSEKDRFAIQTYVCSTKLTQNANLLKILDWKSGKYIPQEALTTFLKVDGGEIVKFLPQILDALFNILESEKDGDVGVLCGSVFHCLVHVLSVVLSKKYAHFLSVVDLYIEEIFHAPLAYRNLIAILKLSLTHGSLSTDFKLKVMESIQYSGKFILRSRQLFYMFYGETDVEAFESSLKTLIRVVMSFCCSAEFNCQTQRRCLKCVYLLLFDIQMAYASEELTAECCAQCYVLVEFIKTFTPWHAKENIMIISDIIQSKIFLLPKCRIILVPAVLGKVTEYLEKSVEVDVCVNCLSNLLEHFHMLKVDHTVEKTSAMMLPLLEYAIEAAIKVDRDTSITGKLMTVIIEILRQMTPENFECYIDYFPNDAELLDFLMAMLILFEELVSRPVFPKDWFEMIMLQNSVILKALKCIAVIIRSQFLHPFNDQVWNNYFHSATAFISQPFLQLEDFSKGKCSRILSIYKDMRKELGFEVKTMWLSVGEYKSHFIPSLVGPFLEMALIPNVELQEAIIPLLFDMAQCEFYSVESSEEHTWQSMECIPSPKFNFDETELEIINKIDMLVEGGKGDEHFKDCMNSILNPLFEDDYQMKKKGRTFMKKIKVQLEKLFEYRSYIKDDSSDNVVIYAYQLLDFYSKIKYEEIYVRYVSKLCERHLKRKDFAEAAKTLSLHAQLLDWSQDVLSTALRCSCHPFCKTNFELKEILYREIINYFDLGKVWHCAISICQELSEVYENMVYDYSKLAGILRQKAEFYDKIMGKTFPETEYFCVSYIGQGFPAFFQNQTFIYRADAFERLQDFSNRIKNQFPRADVVHTIQDESTRSSSHQYIQIIKVFPVFDEENKYSSFPICEQILYHLHESDILKFRLCPSIKFIELPENSPQEDLCISLTDKKEKHLNSKEGFFTKWNSRTILVASHSFPGCLKLFPVKSSVTYEISPILNVIEEIRASNRSLFGILPFDSIILQNMKHVFLKLNEIVNASVVEQLNKGIKMLLKDNCGNLCHLRKLEGLLIEQINLVQVFIQNFAEKAPKPLLKLLHNLKRCAKKLSVFFAEKPLMPPSVREYINEQEIRNQHMAKKASRGRKELTVKLSKSHANSYHSYESRDGNSKWYIPSPSSSSGVSSFVLSKNSELSQSVFHVSTPLSHILPLVSPSSPRSKSPFSGCTSQPTRFSSDSSDSAVGDEIGIDNSKGSLGNCSAHVVSKFECHLKAPISGNSSYSNDNTKPQAVVSSVNIPPALPPKRRDRDNLPSVAEG